MQQDAEHWVDVAKIEEFPINDRKCLHVDGTSLVVFSRVEGFFALENYCPHQGMPLEDGFISGDGLIMCPFHGAQFSLETGESKGPPAFDDVMVFPTRVYQGMVQVKVS